MNYPDTTPIDNAENYPICRKCERPMDGPHHECAPMLTREEAVAVLAAHYLTPTDLTETFAATGEWVPATDFDSVFGVREFYLRREVYRWLGY